MKHLLAVLCVAACGVLVVGAGEPPSAPTIQTPLKEPPLPWTDQPLANDPGTFHFAIVADLTGGERPGIFDKAVKTLNLLQPEFVMSIGDFVPGYAPAAREFEPQWKSFNDRLAKLQMRFFYVPGNHDIGGPSPEVARKVWAAKIGPTYHHFVYRNVLFLCLNSELLADPAIDKDQADQQMAYVKKALDDSADVRWTFVFLHRPLWVPTSTGSWAEIEKLLAARKHTVFAGHVHRYIKAVRNGQSYIALATTGAGAGPSTVLKAGLFDEVAWVTMTPNGPVIANVKLDGVLDENVLTEEMVKKQLDGVPLPKEMMP